MAILKKIAQCLCDVSTKGDRNEAIKRSQYHWGVHNSNCLLCYLDVEANRANSPIKKASHSFISSQARDGRVAFGGLNCD